LLITRNNTAKIVHTTTTNGAFALKQLLFVLQVLVLSCAAACLAAPQFNLNFGSQPQRQPLGRQEAPTIVNFGLKRDHPDQPILILRQFQSQGPDGTYAWDIDLENKIKANENGYLKNAGSKDEAQVAQGGFSFEGPDGQTYSVTYIADENGFQPQGAHLPTPPPIPEELERAYALARADPDYRDEPSK